MKHFTIIFSVKFYYHSFSVAYCERSCARNKHDAISCPLYYPSRSFYSISLLKQKMWQIIWAQKILSSHFRVTFRGISPRLESSLWVCGGHNAVLLSNITSLLQHSLFFLHENVIEFHIIIIKNWSPLSSVEFHCKISFTQKPLLSFSIHSLVQQNSSSPSSSHCFISSSLSTQSVG